MRRISLRDAADDVKSDGSEKNMAHPGSDEGRNDACLAQGDADGKKNVEDKTDADAEAYGRESNGPAADGDSRWDPQEDDDQARERKRCFLIKINFEFSDGIRGSGRREPRNVVGQLFGIHIVHRDILPEKIFRRLFDLKRCVAEIERFAPDFLSFAHMIDEALIKDPSVVPPYGFLGVYF